jgi:pimeloyl-ACP methyl ester carboxylesterase
MFRNLIPRLAASFHLMAPDYPGFGQSSMPDHKKFAYTFENLTNVVDRLVEELGLGKFSLYVMDYGAPVGYRLALRRSAASNRSFNNNTVKPLSFTKAAGWHENQPAA